MAYDIVSGEVTATGTLYTGPCHLKGVYVRSAGTAGTAVFKDGGSGGTTKLTIDTPAAVGAHYHAIPEPGIVFVTDCHVTLTTADAATGYFEPDRSI